MQEAASSAMRTGRLDSFTDGFTVRKDVSRLRFTAEVTHEMSEQEDSMECPECGSEITEKDLLLGLWMCDDCEIGFNDKGAVIAE